MHDRLASSNGGKSEVNLRIAMVKGLEGNCVLVLICVSVCPIDSRIIRKLQNIQVAC